MSGVAFHEGVLADELTSTDLLALALGGVKGSSKTVMVELRGFEPLTPSMRKWCRSEQATSDGLPDHLRLPQPIAFGWHEPRVIPSKTQSWI